MKIVKIYDQWRQDSKHYIVMELLAQNLDNLYPQDGSLNLTQACQVGIEMIHAVREFHKLGFIHKDVKLDNFMIRHKVPQLIVDDTR